jgi:hypothetical protein
MPHRSVILAIVAFWLGTSYWLFQREIRPRLAPGVPPRFAIAPSTDENEARLPLSRLKLEETRWTVTHSGGGPNQKPLSFTGATSVIHHDRQREDLFDLGAILDTAKGAGALHDEGLVRLGRLESTYKVHRSSVDPDAVMTGLKATVVFLTPLGNQAGRFDGEITNGVFRMKWQRQSVGDSRGEIKDGVLQLHFAPGQKNYTSGELEVPVEPGAVVFLPQHPLARIKLRELEPGREWGMYLFDPLDGAAVPGAKPRLAWVNAEVRAEVETLQRYQQDRRCRVIDYEGDNGHIAGSIWVDVENDKVLRMTARLGDDRWDITRE